MTEPDQASPPTFESALLRLEAIVTRLDSDSCGLAEAMQGYEEGVRLVQRCLEQLEDAETRVEELRLELESRERS